MFKSFIKNSENRDEKRWILLTLLFAFIFEFFLGLQGFDLCDEGFALTSYQQIFNSPSSIEYHFLYYLSIFVGGVWNLFFGFGGILSFRILSVIVIVFTIYFTYLSTKQFIKIEVIPVATLSVLILHEYGLLVFYHNYFTSFLLSIGVYLILNSLNKNSYTKLFAGFFFIGMNVFSRIPNITMLSLAILIFIDHVYKKNTRILVKNISFGLLGFIGGIITIIIVMIIFGHFEIFKEAIQNLIYVMSDSDNSHSISNLIRNYISNYITIYTFFSIFIFSTVLFVCLYNYTNKKRLKILCITIFSLIIIIFIFRNFKSEKYYSVILPPIIISYFIDYKNKTTILLNTASLIIMFFLPIGSDFGISNMGDSSIWLATFISTGHIYRFIHYQILQKNNYSYLLFSICFLVLFLNTGLYRISKKAYFDSGSRFKKCYRANNDKFSVFTTKEKVEILNELLLELDKYIDSNDYLFAFESLPAIHYLTETKPYMCNAWPWTYSPEIFKFYLEKSISNNPWPVVLRQKCEPISGNWTIPISENLNKDTYRYKINRVLHFENFLLEYNYKLVWENDLFSIYIH